MESQGINRVSKSSWSSQLQVVEKSDGTWGPCGDYWRLNLFTKWDIYLPLHMENLSARLAGKKIFSKLDLRKGYYQVPMAQQDIPKMAVITPFRLYEFLWMPCGLRNVGQFFQHFMDEVLEGLDCIFVYLDNTLVASNTEKEHKIHLEEVFEQLQQQGLVLHLEKCVFFVSSVESLE